MLVIGFDRYWDELSRLGRNEYDLKLCICAGHRGLGGILMHMITYLSEAKIPEDHLRAEPDQILSVAEQRNATLGISGVLFSRGNTFFQTIEGPVDAVRDVYQSITADTRHENIYLLIDEPINERRFVDWTMECFHDPEFEGGFLGLMHQVGEHFKNASEFGPASIYSYCWRTVDAMAPHRLTLQPSLVG